MEFRLSVRDRETGETTSVYLLAPTPHYAEYRLHQLYPGQYKVISVSDITYDTSIG